VTLIGHGIGGMLTRRAYLEAAGVFEDRPAAAAARSGTCDSISRLNRRRGPRLLRNARHRL